MPGKIVCGTLSDEMEWGDRYARPSSTAKERGRCLNRPRRRLHPYLFEHYPDMQFDHPLATVLVSQFIVLLVVVISLALSGADV